jgi:hypothetical protein
MNLKVLHLLPPLALRSYQRSQRMFITPRLRTCLHAKTHTSYLQHRRGRSQRRLGSRLALPTCRNKVLVPNA